MEIEEEGSEQFGSDMQEIISSPPSWLIQWGMSIFFAVFILIVALSAFVRYPDIIRTQVKISFENLPKQVIARISGRLVKILVRENQIVDGGQPLAYIESIGNHEAVLETFADLLTLRRVVTKGEKLSSDLLSDPRISELGELQPTFNDFYKSFLDYKASTNGGFKLNKLDILRKELRIISNERKYLISNKTTQQKEYEIARQEYEMHKKLYAQKIIALIELKREEAKLLANLHPVEQAEVALLNNSSRYDSKQKEILELQNDISQTRAVFLHSLNKQISEFQDWKSKYILAAPQNGRVNYAGIVQENQYIKTNQEVFYVNAGDTRHFAEMSIPQYNMGKVAKGQVVLIKLKSYPHEEFGIMEGRIVSIDEIPFRDSVFLSRVNFKLKNSQAKKINLKSGMLGDAEIITQDVSLLRRLARSIVKSVK